jgi:hypothetical protein
MSALGPFSAILRLNARFAPIVLQ